MIEMDTAAVASSIIIQDVIDKVSNETGVNRNRIFPIRNYEDQRKIDPVIDYLVLAAMDTLMDVATDGLIMMIRRGMAKLSTGRGGERHACSRQCKSTLAIHESLTAGAGATQKRPHYERIVRRGR